MNVASSSPESREADEPPGGSGAGRHRGSGPPQVGYRALAHIPEFRALWAAQALSYAGDQVAQVAVALLVYERTGSALLTGLAYALAYLPLIAGRALLSGLAEALPRRRLLVGIDLLRAALALTMALPAIPLAGACTALFAVVLLGSPHAAARTALAGEILPPDSLVHASAVSNITFQASQIAGFLTVGVLSAAFGPQPALAADAGAYALAAALIARWVAARPGPAWPGRPRPFRAVLRGGWATVVGRPELRALMLFGWLAAFAVVPEGLAIPYAHVLRGGPLTVGLLMSAMPVGLVAGAAALNRLASPPDRLRIMGWLAMLSCAPLTASLLHPPLALLLPLWALAGAGTAYQLAAARAFVRALPHAARSDAFALAQTGLLAAQGLAVLGAGAIADRYGPEPVVAFAGLAGMAAAGVLATCWARHRYVLAARLGEGPDPVGGRGQPAG